MKSALRNFVWLGLLLALVAGASLAQDGRVLRPTGSGSPSPAPNTSGGGKASKSTLVGKYEAPNVGPTFFYEFVWSCYDEEFNCNGDDVGHRIVEIVPDNATVVFDSVTTSQGTCTVETPALIACDLGLHLFGVNIYVEAQGTRSDDSDYVIFNYETSGPAEVARYGFVFNPLAVAARVGKNMSFESGLTADWTRANLATNTGVKCGVINAPKGSCVLNFAPLAAKNQKISQVIPVTSLNVNDYLWIGFDNKAKNLLNDTGANLTVRLNFKDNTTAKLRWNIEPGTYGWWNTWYQTYMWKSVKSVTVLLNNQKISSGNWQIDNIMIVSINVEDIVASETP